VTIIDPGVGVGVGKAATFVADSLVLANGVVSSRPLPVANTIRTIVPTDERIALRLFSTIFPVTFFPGASLLGSEVTPAKLSLPRESALDVVLGYTSF
jgi:hypothetical protein